MLKPKLFLNSNDVADLTGYSQRNARKIMSHIRDQLGLSKAQAISIYGFAEVFNVPADILFIYINSKNFKALPVSREHLTQLESKDVETLSHHSKYFNSEEFEGLISKKRVSEIGPSEVE